MRLLAVAALLGLAALLAGTPDLAALDARAVQERLRDDKFKPYIIKQ